jgi:hypothetical protein
MCAAVASPQPPASLPPVRRRCACRAPLPQGVPDAESTWAAVQDLLGHAARLVGAGAAGPAAAPGRAALRMAGARLCERAAMLLTADEAPVLAGQPGAFGRQAGRCSGAAPPPTWAAPPMCPPDAAPSPPRRALRAAGPGQFGPPLSRLPGAAALARAAADAARPLAELVASPTAPQLPGPALISCLKALAVLCLRRPALLPQAMPALLELADRVRT